MLDALNMFAMLVGYCAIVLMLICALLAMMGWLLHRWDTSQSVRRITIPDNYTPCAVCGADCCYVGMHDACYGHVRSIQRDGGKFHVCEGHAADPVRSVGTVEFLMGNVDSSKKAARPK